VTTTNVPSDQFDDLKRDVEDATRYSNSTSPYTNRVGQQIRPIPLQAQDIAGNLAAAEQALANSGFIPKGDFTTGGTVEAKNEVFSDGADYWRYDGALPFTVNAGSSPTPTGVGAWLNVSDGTLRSQLADPNSTVLIGGVEINDLVRNWKSVFVESFRLPAYSDSETIQAALDYIDTLSYSGVKLVFEQGKTYNYNAEHSIKNINNLLIDLNGATLRRVNGSETSTQLSSSLTVAGGTTFTVDSVPANWKVGEFITVFTSANDEDTSRNRRRITAISGNDISITAAFEFSPAKATLPVGTTIAKAFSAFAGRPSSADSTAYPLTAGNNRRIFIANGTIDGNRANQLNVSWRFIPEILLHSNGGVIEKVNFKNITSETFVGHGVTIQDCVFEDVGGSCYHTSVSDDTLSEAGFAWFTRNTVKRVGLATNAAVGHSEGAVTFSWNAGNLVVSDNIMESLTEYMLGYFGPSTGGESDEFLMVSNNIVKGAKGIIQEVIDPPLGIHITDNIFHNCASNITQANALSDSDKCTFRNNTMTGTTTGTQRNFVDRQKVGAKRDGNVFTASVMDYVANTIIPAYTPSIDSSAVRVTEKDGASYHAFISTGQSGHIHYHPGGNASGSAYSMFNPATLTYILGTNITGGSVEIKAEGFTTKAKVSSAGLELPSFNGLYMGEEDVDGSWRFSISGTSLVIQKREAGVWNTKQTILA